MSQFAAHARSWTVSVQIVYECLWIMGSVAVTAKFTHTCKACHNQTEIVGYLEQSKAYFILNQGNKLFFMKMLMLGILM